MTKTPVFIGEPIRVIFINDPEFHRKPVCPNSFIWRGETFIIIELLSEWQDFNRKGKNRLNMSDVHLNRAGIKGSYGVGRYYFRVLTEELRLFDLYFDRALANNLNLALGWILLQEIFCEQE